MATRVLPEVASQKQGSGAMQASVEMMGSSRAPATITAPFEGSDNQEVSSTGLVLGDDASAEDQHEVEYNSFQGRDYLEGCSLTGLGSALSRGKTVVTPSSTQLALWRQVRGSRTMESMKVDVVEGLYPLDLLAKSFLDPEPPLDVPVSAKQQLADGALRKHQRDMGLVVHALTTGLKDLDRASNLLMGVFEEIRNGHTKDRVREAQR